MQKLCQNNRESISTQKIGKFSHLHRYMTRKRLVPICIVIHFKRKKVILIPISECSAIEHPKKCQKTVTRNEKKTNKLSFQFHAHKNKSTTFSLISNNLLSVEMKKMNLISSSYSRCRVRERKNLQLLRSIDAVLLNQISVVLSKNGPIVRH